jgi:hypothetical protein
MHHQLLKIQAIGFYLWNLALILPAVFKALAHGAF